MVIYMQKIKISKLTEEYIYGYGYGYKFIECIRLQNNSNDAAIKISLNNNTIQIYSIYRTMADVLISSYNIWNKNIRIKNSAFCKYYNNLIYR